MGSFRDLPKVSGKLPCLGREQEHESSGRGETRVRGHKAHFTRCEEPKTGLRVRHRHLWHRVAEQRLDLRPSTLSLKRAGSGARVIRTASRSRRSCSGIGRRSVRSDCKRLKAIRWVVRQIRRTESIKSGSHCRGGRPSHRRGSLKLQAASAPWGKRRFQR